MDPSNQDRFRDRFTLAGAKDDSRDAEEDSQLRISFRKTSLFIFCKIIKRISHARRAYDAPRPLFPGYLFIERETGLHWRPILGTFGIRTVVCHGKGLPLSSRALSMA